jgi:hypothetical protein
VYAEENVIVLLDTDATAELIAGIPMDSGVTTGPDMLDAHPACTVEGEVAIGWSTTSNDGAQHFHKRRKITAKTTARTPMMPPMTPPVIAAGDDAECEDGVGVLELQQAIPDCQKTMRQFQILIGRKGFSHFTVIVEKDPVGNVTVDLMDVSIRKTTRMEVNVHRKECTCTCVGCK